VRIGTATLAVDRQAERKLSGKSESMVASRVRPILKKAALLIPSINKLYLENQSLSRRIEDFKLQSACGVGQETNAGTADMPSLLMVTLPKSGTVYLNAVFQQSLGLHKTQLCNGYFPRDLVSSDRLEHFMSQGGYVASTHLDASPANLQLLDAFGTRWIVHIRDPRAALLSWVHHVRRLHQEGAARALLNVTPTPPAVILTGDLGPCITWHIEQFFRPAIHWIEMWVKAAEARPNRVLLTEFAGLALQEEAFCRKISAFLGVDASGYKHRPPAKTMTVHFRLGELDEWKRVFTPEQIEQTSAMIPLDMMKRFGWQTVLPNHQIGASKTVRVA
jgi:hypothetical protein